MSDKIAVRYKIKATKIFPLGAIMGQRKILLGLNLGGVCATIIATSASQDSIIIKQGSLFTLEHSFRLLESGRRHMPRVSGRAEPQARAEDRARRPLSPPERPCGGGPPA